ncbi:hypothetical protein B5J96_1731 [Lactiplantibacillus plantarum]|nr:hypothetical protein B5J96_1731 [Lactiplantibacillus plantarum]
MNLRAGISRFAGFRVRCITTLPTLHMVLNKYSIIFCWNKYLFKRFKGSVKYQIDAKILRRLVNNVQNINRNNNQMLYQLIYRG